jgi:hypothetical protein
MPEIKSQFTGGKMNKDLDERLLPKGEYRDAMNVQVATSEGSEVGTVQNILGNKQIYLYQNFELSNDAKTVGCIADEKNNTLYYLVWDTTGSYIMSYLRGDTFVHPVFVDHDNVLGFESNTQITGINIIDDMLFWTDNKTEPKKINITRSKQGTPTFSSHTKFINKSRFTDANAPNAQEKHITVIKKGPNTTLRLELLTSRDASKIYTGVINVASTNAFASAGGLTSTNPSSFMGEGGNATYRHNFINITAEEGSNTFNISIVQGVDSSGDVVSIGPINSNTGLTGWHKPNPDYSLPPKYNNINIGTKIAFKPFVQHSSGVFIPPSLPIKDYTIKGVVVDYWVYGIGGVEEDQFSNNSYSTSSVIKVKVLAIDGYIPTGTNQFAVDLWDETEKLFEFKFPRFSYRYKYEDGEYSTFAPWTPVAFQPGPFDYHPKKGYNLGMVNTINKIHLFGLVDSNTPKDVTSIDILYKDEQSPNIYIVDTIRPDDFGTFQNPNKWNSILNGEHYSVEREAINSIVPSNQLLRPWDNVPRRALAQDVSGNRIIYANYVQNYDLLVGGGNNLQKYIPKFTFEWSEFNAYEQLIFSNAPVSSVVKSVKSLREYQLGVVFVDKYGRETPVISNETGTKKLEKNRAGKYNRINVSLSGDSGFPNHKDLKHFKFYVKESAGEYYNMAMDRWYDAEDGNVWLAFPSSDRNKIDINTFLILKKGKDKDYPTTETARYNVIAIENDAPDFIKTKKTLALSLSHSSSKLMYNSSSGGLNSNDPIEGRGAGDTPIKIKYKAFIGSPGMRLDEYKEGKLYIEWEDPITKQVSDRYEIVSIDNDHLSLSSSLPSIEDAVYTIQLAKNLGNDVNFITDDPDGSNPSKIEYGIKTNIYKYVVENKPEFDGRFFVKLYEDENFKTNVAKSFEDDLDYVVLQSKKVFCMKPMHKAIHTSNIDDFLVSGNWSPPTALEDPTDDIGTDSGYGYYEIREFASMALFFRRYAKSVLGTPNGDDQLLVHLRPGTTLGNALAGNTEGWLGTNLTSIDLNRTYLGENWRPVANWNLEYGAHSPWEEGYTNWFKRVENDPVFSPLNNLLLISGNSYKLETVNLGADWSSKETQVWFIDNGPYAGSAYDYGTNTGNGDLDWGKIGKYEQFISGPEAGTVSDNWNVMSNTAYVPATVLANDDVGTNADNISLHKGIVNNTSSNTHSMNLAFGGIKGATNGAISPGFFNIGNWNTNSASNDYSDLAQFVQNINPDFKFRWKQDPNKQQNVYTIGGDIQSSGYLRHSTERNSTIARMDSSEEDVVLGAASMAELLSFNFTKNWKMNDISPSYTGRWNPLTDGKIDNCLEVTLTVCDNSGSTTGTTTATGSTIADDLKIYVTSLNDATNNNLTLVVGMAFSDYTKANLSSPMNILGNISVLNTNPNGINDFLVVRRIEALDGYGSPATGSNITHYALTFGGYREPLRTDGEHKLAEDADLMPKVGSTIKFVQVGMNGYSPNSEFNINTIAKHHTTWGAVTAVGYDIEFIEYIEPDETLSENPAIFETVPKELPDIDIYYEASADIPMVINSETIASAFPIGSKLLSTKTAHNVVGYDNNRLLVQAFTKQQNFESIPNIGPITCIRQDGLQFKPTITDIQTVSYPTFGTCNSVTFNANLYNLNYQLNWYNCFSFGNGVESNRIRDNFNLPYMLNGVKASTTLEYEYKEEHRKYGLIYSGLYNAISGLNNLNQFIQAEKITKDINPIYGSIQKLHARDGDLVTLCEDKILKILSQKDALYNADGNVNLTATEGVLGQAIPFAGEYGISTNPESFASESYRVYFTDKIRGAVLRLSMDGLTPISDAGMKDWFRDNLKLANRVIGSYDDRNDEYVLKLDYSYVPQSANLITPGCMDPLAMNYNALANSADSSCAYFPETAQASTVPYNWTSGDAAIDQDISLDFFGTIYGCMILAANNYNPSANTPCIGCCTYDTDSWDCVNGGCVLDSTGWGEYTTLSSCQIGCNAVTYDCAYTPPSQGGIGWGCYDMGYGTGNYTTLADCQTNCGLGANTYECMGGYCIPTYQLSGHPGIGTFSDLAACQASCTSGSPNTWNYAGCTDSNATNYDVDATVDDGSCTYAISGCTNPLASNYNSSATVDDYSCITYNCMSSGCVGVNASATVSYGLYYSMQACSASCNTSTGFVCTAPTTGFSWESDPFAFPPITEVTVSWNSVAGASNGYTLRWSLNPTFLYNTTVTVTSSQYTINNVSISVGQPLYWQVATNCNATGTISAFSSTQTIAALQPAVLGCTDPTALNYDATATVDNGSCYYGTSGGGGSS